MYIESVPNRDSPPCILLRESYRENGKVRKRTIANLTDWPPEVVQKLRLALKGGVVVSSLEEVFEVTRTLPHGHVAAVTGMLRELGLDKLITPRPSRRRDLVVAMIVARILDPQPKLGMARALDSETATTSLGEVLGLGAVDADELYDAMDFALERQTKIEDALAKRHLHEGSLVLYDVTSTYFEGHSCPLAKHGYSRDGKPDKLQIEFGLLCDADGCPVAVEVFEGNVSDPMTVAAQVSKLRDRIKLRRVVVVGDRGMLTEARVHEDLAKEGLDWITALRAPAIRGLLGDGSLQLSLFDERDLGEITSESYPGERLIVCRNPFMAEERKRKREALLQATEQELGKVVEATRRARNPLRGEGNIGLRVGRVLNKHKMAKHFELHITADAFSYSRQEAKIAEEASLDGIYVVRTSVPAEALSAAEAVDHYKSLSRVERAFRSLKTVDLKVRPIHHRLADRVRAHVFLCMLSYYVEWHLRRAWAELLFEDDDRSQARAARSSVVARAERSEKALSKAQTRRTEDGWPVHSFQTLLSDLGTLARCTCVRPALGECAQPVLYTKPTPLQEHALNLLRVTHRL